jgi:hypothetical protein
VENAQTSSEEDNGVLIYALIRMNFVHPIFPVSTKWNLKMLVDERDRWGLKPTH